MFWLIDNILKEEYYFLQIFSNNYIDCDSNKIYKLNELIDYKETENYVKFNFLIKIMGQLISYTNLETNVTITFSKTENFIDPNLNVLNKPVFEYNYKIIDNYRLPELLSKQYDYYYEDIELTIFIINNNLLFVKENNKLTNSKRNYWITKDLSTVVI
jgi:hypothetical protein